MDEGMGRPSEFLISASISEVDDLPKRSIEWNGGTEWVFAKGRLMTMQFRAVYEARHSSAS